MLVDAVNHAWDRRERFFSVLKEFSPRLRLMMLRTLGESCDGCVSFVGRRRGAFAETWERRVLGYSTYRTGETVLAMCSCCPFLLHVCFAGLRARKLVNGVVRALLVACNVSPRSLLLSRVVKCVTEARWFGSDLAWSRMMSKGGKGFACVRVLCVVVCVDTGAR